jgi:hypothetical protein
VGVGPDRFLHRLGFRLDATEEPAAGSLVRDLPT